MDPYVDPSSDRGSLVLKGIKLTVRGRGGRRPNSLQNMHSIGESILRLSHQAAAQHAIVVTDGV